MGLFAANSVSIHQPNYIPWLGYFYKIYQADHFVFLDDVQFSNEGMHNYHYIKTPQGSFRLKIPVLWNFGMKVGEVKTKDDMGWKEKHLKTLLTNYKRAKYFDVIYEDFAALLKMEYQNLAAMNEAIIVSICQKLGINKQFIRSSSLNLESSNEERIIDICKSLGCKTYYSGTGAKNYQNEENFNKNGILLEYSHFKPFLYPQQWDGTQTNVTILDYLMNCGYDWERVIDNQIKL